tara:strand:+ start:194 stop:298 length:105 start_codon:yes stop_codon:yes gene_type:complete
MATTDIGEAIRNPGHGKKKKKKRDVNRRESKQVS